MIPELNAASFEFFARYVLSGFLIFMIRNAYVVAERPKIAEIALDIGLFGLVNQVVWRFATFVAPLVASLFPPLPWGRSFALSPEVLFYLEVLATPVAIGILSGRALRQGWLRGAARIVALPIVDPIPRAYDHVFATRGTGFVILSFQDGETVFGYYGPASRAGRDPGRSELYLERLYDVDDDGNWTETAPPRSALINLAGLRAIEFIEEDRHGTQAAD